MKPAIWVVYEKIGKQKYMPAYWFGFFHGQRAEEQAKRSAMYLQKTTPRRKYKAVKFVPECTN